jgi:hypothetical protein
LLIGLPVDEGSNEEGHTVLRELAQRFDELAEDGILCGVKHIAQQRDRVLHARTMAPTRKTSEHPSAAIIPPMHHALTTSMLFIYLNSTILFYLPTQQIKISGLVN